MTSRPSGCKSGADRS